MKGRRLEDEIYLFEEHDEGCLGFELERLGVDPKKVSKVNISALSKVKSLLS